MKVPSNGLLSNSSEGERKNINSELWHACAGPLVSLPPVGSLVVYFPQGHSEQVAASMQKDTDSIPNYPNLPSKLICVLHNVILHADPETDEVYAQMTLQPVNKYDKEALLASDLGLKQSKQPAEFFCKTLTASDTSTHGGFSVPRRAAEKIFPPLDFSMQPPAQELVAKDLHDVAWTFRHIYRGQPKRHLLTTGWSVFVSTKRLYAGDSVLFIRDEKSQLMLGIRRANRQQPALSSSVISSDSMHIGILAAAAHASANNSPFTIFYNPRASQTEFVVPLAKYNKAMYTQVSLGMRFRMMFETEESGVRRYMGTITGISDLDPIRWKNSQWRNLQVGWDESAAGDRPTRVSIWEIEPVATPFYLCPPPFFRPKFPKQPGMPDEDSDMENAFKRAMPWLGDDISIRDVQNPMFPGLSLVQWMSMQQNPQFSATQSGFFPPPMGSSTAFHNTIGTDDPSKILNFQSHALNSQNQSNALATRDFQFNMPKVSQESQQIEQIHRQTQTWTQQQPQQQQPQQQQQQRQTLMNVQVQQQHLAQQLQPQQQQKQQQHHQQQQQQQQQHQQPQQQQPQQQQQQQQQRQQQQPQQQQQHHQLLQLQQHQQQQLQKQQLPQQQHLQPQQQLHQQQLLRQDLVGNVVAATQVLNQNLQQPIVNSQHQQQQLTATNFQSPQNLHSSNLNSQQSASILQDLQLDQQLDQQQSLSQRQLQQLPLSQHQLQMQFLQKLQQQQQLLSQVSSPLQPHQVQQQQGLQQNQHFQQQQQQQQQQHHQQQQQQQHHHQQHHHQQQPQQQQQELGNAVNVSPSMLNQLPPLSSSHLLGQQKPPASIRPHSCLTDGDARSCSTSPSNTNCQVPPSNFINRMHQGSVILAEDTVVQPACNLVQELQNKPDAWIKQELPNPKEPDQVVYRSAITDTLEASSSATSYCLDGSSLQQNSLPNFCLDGEVQTDPPNNLLFGVNIDGLAPDALLSRRFGSGKDLQNLLSSYGEREIETELSTAAISSQSFGMPDMPFKPGCSNDAGINENGSLNRGLWGNQATQRMRTFTKVQKRGSVGRSIDVTRYIGYDELRHDLARMFGIEGQLDDPHRSEWKLVYVDHENDILLVGDDPWEEFVSCVQSIKILSSAEVQQMSLDGDLGNVQVHNPACSGGSGSGNAWRGHYDDNSAASFDR